MASRRSEIRRAGTLALFAIAFSLWLTAPARAQTPCFGDCNNDGHVLVNELVICVNIALNIEPITLCTACSSNGTTVIVSDIVKAVNNALNGCPGVASSTPTNTPPGGPTFTNTPTPTNTVKPCPLQEGTYTITSQSGGFLKVASFSPFPFPPFGATVADTGPGDANCIHSVVVPYPGGFTSPVFCVPALGATTQVLQTGCGLGQIDSDGGSDYTVTELGDTSFTSTPPAPTCDIHQTSCPPVGPAPDSSILVRVAVGDNKVDTCTGGGTANYIGTIPVFTTTWVAEDSSCPDVDGTYNMNTDTLLSKFPQILDFTTDVSTATFKDLDGDGCFKSGTGPISYTGPGVAGPNWFCQGPGKPVPCCTGTAAGTCSGATGTCMDLTKRNETFKECQKPGADGKTHAVCTMDGDCGTNGPCAIGECYKNAAEHCNTADDCKECQGALGTPCTADADCSGKGPCLNLGSPCEPLGVVVGYNVATGTVGSSGMPLYDLLFNTFLPVSFTGPEARLHATCDASSNPPAPSINFTGTVDRCIQGP